MLNNIWKKSIVLILLMDTAAEIKMFSTIFLKLWQVNKWR